MKIAVVKSLKGKVENLVIFAKGKDLLGDWKSVDPQLEKKVSEQARKETFKGKAGQSLCFYPEGRVIVVGTDGKPEWGGEWIRRAASAAYSKAKSMGAEKLTIVVPKGKGLTHAAVEGLLLTAYTFDKYKSKKKDDPATEVKEAALLGADEAEAKTGRIYAEATCRARDLVNEHAGYMTPRRLADTAKQMCKGLQVEIHDEKWIEKQGMNALRAVSLGSIEPPRFVHIRYTAPGAKKTIAVIGKGVTFDSGGLCIKPADGMMEMKADMAGAANVAAIMSALKELGPKVNVHGIFGATENMPGEGAYKMRDVVRAMNGKTMEITNTDAEGRVILSDALAFASTLKPDAIVDMATLTGACVVALGPKWSAVFGTDKKLINGLRESASSAGERLWEMPLEQEYFEDYLKSDVADMKNSGGRWGGAILGALFLQQFVDDKIPWAHIDMAGAAIWPGAKHYVPAGASGAITRTILRYIESLA